jgi:hypothetical protein
LWVARALGLSYTGYAVDGARATDVVRRQIPAHRRIAADPDARYEVGCLYIGVNDVRALDWDPGSFGRDFRDALAFVAERSSRTLALTIPSGLGLPPAGTKVEEANLIIEAAAREAGALIVDLRGFRGRRLLMADQVHPTAFGQLAIASKALEVLAAEGLPARADPWSLVTWEETPLGRARGDLTYAYRRAKAELRAMLAKKI